jgi:hypothetical protein
VKARLAALATLIALAWWMSPAPASSSPEPVSVSISRSWAHVQVGQRLAFTTLVRNNGSRPLTGLVAHLNVVSLRPDVYVDPEDWSAPRTQYLPPVGAHAAADLRWTVQAVNEGDIDLYVAVTRRHGTDRVVSSAALRVMASAQRILDPAGALPVTLGVPAALVLLMVVAAVRRRGRSVTR